MTDDIETLRAELAHARARADLAEERLAGREPPPRPTFTRSQIRDVEFFGANKDAIIAAARRGDIVDDIRNPELAPSRPEPRTFTRDELRDPAFYQAHQREIEAAAKAGRILPNPGDTTGRRP